MQLGAPVRATHAYLKVIQLDDVRASRRALAAVLFRSRSGGVRLCTASSPLGFETLEHTGNGVLAPQHDAGNLRHFVVLLG
jgi:hypothetical protein